MKYNHTLSADDLGIHYKAKRLKADEVLSFYQLEASKFYFHRCDLERIS